MVETFRDRFDRADATDGPGPEYTIACGSVGLYDQTLWPVGFNDPGVSGLSTVFGGTTDRRVQCFYTAQELDSPDMEVRAVWHHIPTDADIIGGDLETVADVDPSFTILARASKDPLLIDLLGDEEPSCYDEGYGLRVTCPRDGSAPVLKLVKLSPPTNAPGVTRAPSTEIDGSEVLASVTLSRFNLNTDADQEPDGPVLYRGNVQDMRLRVTLSESEVKLEGFLNDRNRDTAVIEHTDRKHPLWNGVGVPGIEWLGGNLSEQPSGSSPFSETAIPLIGCHLFHASTVRVFRRPNTVSPQNLWTYRRVTERVIQLVEKDGDARFTGTVNQQNRLDIYLRFIIEAENHIIREVGHYQWLEQSQEITLIDGQGVYELPSNVAEIRMIRPGNFNTTPLREIESTEFRERVVTITGSGGQPRVYTLRSPGINNRPRIEVYPVPSVAGGLVSTVGGEPFIVVDYYARPGFPAEPERDLPFVPQEDMDVLIYGAASHSLLIDSDPTNAQLFAQTYMSKMKDLKRKEYRKHAGRRTIMRSVSDARATNISSRIPLLRATQLESLTL